jgi:archaellum biogenesis protein FlaJ (TadC family)
LQATPELEAMLGSLDEFDGLYRTIIVAFYATVILVSAIFQGLNALYYFTRRKYVNAYLQETPAWVQEIERMTSGA